MPVCAAFRPSRAPECPLDHWPYFHADGGFRIPRNAGTGVAASSTAGIRNDRQGSHRIPSGRRVFLFPARRLSPRGCGKDGSPATLPDRPPCGLLAPPAWLAIRCKLLTCRGISPLRVIRPQSRCCHRSRVAPSANCASRAVDNVDIVDRPRSMNSRLPQVKRGRVMVASQILHGQPDDGSETDA